MPNWCVNELTVQVHPDDKDKLKALMFNSDDKLDFELASPCPKALAGMLLGSKEKVEFNKGLGTRATLLNTSECISLLRQKNKNKYEIDPQRFCFIRDKLKTITDKQIIKEEYEDIPTTIGDDVYQAELLFIDEFEKELTSHPSYTPSTPVEDILECILNSHKYNDSDTQAIIYSEQYAWIAVNKCSPAIQYVVKLLGRLYLDECKNAYGNSDDYEWYIVNWGTKWNAYESQPSDDFTHVLFETAWSPPTDWLHDLADKVIEVGIRDFSATLKYAESGVWFGGEFFISEPDDYWDDYWGDEEIEDFLGIKSDLDDGSEEEIEEL